MLPIFITSEEAINEAITLLLPNGNDPWHQLYRDKKSAQVWYLSEYYDWEPSLPQSLRRGNPSVKETIDFILGSTCLDSIAAAAYYLTSTHQSLYENKEALICAIEEFLTEENRTNEDWERLATALIWSGANSALNRRSPVGKKQSEVIKDYAHFEQLANRASTIVIEAENRVGRNIAPHAFAMDYQ